jgi:hypothetical protein
MSSVRERYGEAFWRAHHEAWLQSELNQREYCEAYGIPIKAFGNWRARFKAEPHPPARKVLYRRGGVNHALSHGLSHDLRVPGPIVPPAREGRRREVSCPGIGSLKRQGIARVQGMDAYGIQGHGITDCAWP